MFTKREKLPTLFTGKGTVKLVESRHSTIFKNIHLSLHSAGTGKWSYIRQRVNNPNLVPSFNRVDPVSYPLLLIPFSYTTFTFKRTKIFLIFITLALHYSILHQTKKMDVSFDIKKWLSR